MFLITENERTKTRNTRAEKNRKKKRKTFQKSRKKKKKSPSTSRRLTFLNIQAVRRKEVKTGTSSTRGRTSTRRARAPSKGKGTSRLPERVSPIKNNLVLFVNNKLFQNQSFFRLTFVYFRLLLLHRTLFLLMLLKKKKFSVSIIKNSSSYRSPNFP